MNSIPLSSESGTPAAAAENGRAVPSQATRTDARQWQSYLNRGLAQNSRAATPERGGMAREGPATPAPTPPPQGASAAQAPVVQVPPAAKGALRHLAANPTAARLATRATPSSGPPPGVGEILPKGGEGLSTISPGLRYSNLQVAVDQSQAIVVNRSGMAGALPASMMIADLSSARFSSLPTTTTPVSGGDAFSEEGSGNALSQPRPDFNGDSTEIRPMRWILPWLWQLSQSPVEEGEPIEWEVELPEGDTLRLHAVRHYGEWILDFAGSSPRLQRWLDQHTTELCGRLQRIIGKPVHLFVDPQRSTSTAS